MKKIEKDEVIHLTYIKNGIEKKVFTTAKDILKAKNLFNVSSDKPKITVAKDIEFLHLKKFSFLNITEIECQNPETVLILEQCVFKKTTSFLKGSIVLESPEFINPTGEYLAYNLLFCENDYVEFILREENDYNYENNIYQIKDVKNVKITGNASKLNVTEPNCLGVSKLQNLTIKGAKHYYAGVLNAQNIVIEDSEVESLAHLKYKKLAIKNSLISSHFNNYLLNLNQGEVEIHDSTLKGKTILLPEGTYEPKNGTLLLNKRSLLTAMLTCLKKIAEQNKETETNKQAPTPLDCRLLKKPNQAFFSEGIRKDFTPNLNDDQSLEEWYKNVSSTILYRSKARIKQC